MKMKNILSNSFYGCKKFLHPQYEQLTKTKSLPDQQISLTFTPYTETLSTITSTEANLTLLDIFCQFIRTNAYQFIHLPYQKLSTWLQICAHVFQYSFQKHLSKKQSFQYFSQVVVRHSLFRPPHCVSVFSYEEVKQFRDIWMDSFVRFYEEYRQCFEAQLNQVVYTVVPDTAPLEELTSTKKEIPREDFKAKFGTMFQIHDAPKKSP